MYILHKIILLILRITLTKDLLRRSPPLYQNVLEVIVEHTLNAMFYEFPNKKACLIFILFFFFNKLPLKENWSVNQRFCVSLAATTIVYIFFI